MKCTLRPLLCKKRVMRWRDLLCLTPLVATFGTNFRAAASVAPADEGTSWSKTVAQPRHHM
eukprot:8582391-Prorocentrum_lima.AAC.1